MKGYQTSCFVCVCNLRERELLGAISIKAWLCCSMEEPAITLPLLLAMRWKVFETQCCHFWMGCHFSWGIIKGFLNKAGESSWGGSAGHGVQGAGEPGSLGSWSCVLHVGTEVF